MMDQQETEQARELHRTLEFIGLRAQATTVGLIQLCAELEAAGVLKGEAIARIKDAIFREMAVTPPRGYHRSACERTRRARRAAIFPRANHAEPRSPVATVADMASRLGS